MASEPSHESSPPQKPKIVLAKWSTRFWAWLLDFITVMTAAEIIFSVAYALSIQPRNIVKSSTGSCKIFSSDLYVLCILDVL